MCTPFCTIHMHIAFGSSPQSPGQAGPPTLDTAAQELMAIPMHEECLGHLVGHWYIVAMILSLWLSLSFSWSLYCFCCQPFLEVLSSVPATSTVHHMELSLTPCRVTAHTEPSKNNKGKPVTTFLVKFDDGVMKRQALLEEGRRG